MSTKWKLSLAVLLLATSFARADSFGSLEVYQPGGAIVPLTPGATNSITWSFAPNELGPGSTPFLVFFFPLDPINALFTSTLTLDGFGSDVFKTMIDGRVCGAELCAGIASLVLPRFWGERSGSISFTFGDQHSRTYDLHVMEPVPEPGSLLLMGSGVTALAFRLRKKYGKAAARA